MYFRMKGASVLSDLREDLHKLKFTRIKIVPL
jgi:hypothetical protein